ncbi:hypothetical protein Tco_1334091 [Tanacetum coccineum]
MGESDTSKLLFFTKTAFSDRPSREPSVKELTSVEDSLPRESMGESDTTKPNYFYSEPSLVVVTRHQFIRQLE